MCIVKELVTVKGTMDAKALAEHLKERFKKESRNCAPEEIEEADNVSDEGGKEKGRGNGG
uniref:HMA domain-containing protein n=1 Tax=Fagus sylvatica TaxID=28930 RepID=A0A2N9IIY1_FAGSY